MKKIKVEDAAGTVLAHDITRIVPGKFKGAAFKKGQVVRREDIGKLIEIGKRHLYVLELSDDELHENEAALRIAAAVSGKNLIWSAPHEGKTNISAKTAGMLKVDTGRLLQINKLGDIILSTLKNCFPCAENQILAATRIIPLVISREKIERLEKIAKGKSAVLNLSPFRKMRVGAVITGSEIYEGLIPDEFDTYVGKKLVDYECRLVEKIIVPDDPLKISGAIRKLKKLGCELVITTGGLSVDPDDVTVNGIKQSGAEIIVYGSPVLPGAMFLYAVMEKTHILGLPACVYYHGITIFDIVLPRLLAGVPITADSIAELGHGGLCLNCRECRYPLCPFGK